MRPRRDGRRNDPARGEGAKMTRSCFDDILPLLPHVLKPSRYLPPIRNGRAKPFDEADVRWILAFPDVAETGCSHHGLEILYHILNDAPGCMAERAFSPWPDMEKEMRGRSIPLLSAESFRPVAGFDILGITLQYELSYTNVLGLIDLAGLPLRSADRDDSHPIVAAGGPCATNPEPMAPFIDFFLIGDGEEGVLAVTEIVRRWKCSGGGKRELLERLCAVRGVYVPALFESAAPGEGDGSNRTAPLRPKTGVPATRRAILSDLSASPPPERPVLSAVEPIHDRVYTEIARGCGVGCRFCHAGFVYRPLRERPEAEVVRSAATALRATGHSTITLASLSSGDHAEIVPILRRLNRELRDEAVSLSLPSLRACTLSDEVITEVSGNRKSSFTIAPEAGSERMLRLINKGITRDMVLDVTERIVRRGWTLLKLYFLIGLPTEEDEDVDGIATLSNEVCRIGKAIAGRKFRVNVSVSNLVPKPHTPFQWEAQEGVERVLEKQRRIRRALDDRAISLQCHSARQSAVEDILARGDRRIAGAIEAVYRGGARFDEWKEEFSYAAWIDALRKEGIDPDDCHRERSEDEPLPWDPIDIGITRRFLLRERHRGYAARGTPFCRKECRVCRSCDDETFVVRGSTAGGPALLPTPDGTPADRTENLPDGIHRIRFRFNKSGSLRFLSQLEVLRIFRFAIRRAKLPVGHSQGFHPRLRISFGLPLAVGHEGCDEPVEIVFHRDVDPRDIERRLNRELPEGIDVFRGEEVLLHGPGLDSLAEELEWEVTIPEHRRGEPIATAIDRFLSKDEVLVERARKGKTRILDIRPGVRRLEMAPEGDRFFARTSADCKFRLVLLDLAGGDERLVHDLAVRRTAFRLAGEPFGD